jgi:hypothetical protein
MLAERLQLGVLRRPRTRHFPAVVNAPVLYPPSAGTAILRQHHADYPDRGVDADQRTGGSYSATTSRITSVAADARG